MMKKHMPPPFPQALHGKKEIKNSSEILESREVTVTKNAFLTEQVSAIIRRHLYPEEEEGFEEMCLINTLVEEHCDKSLEESLNESLEVLEDGKTHKEFCGGPSKAYFKPLPVD
ncbi:hypothetical protein CK203_045874 [Vitis vinifera]|uniref:Uncharacterized protein n=1 Tax=Vitis vinifera TaxID=29760 RepID=A0A438FM88_VITVI|nr:hypothetical protein CK203_045874 [Vitis vinifera]